MRKYGIQLGTIVLLVINILTNEVIGYHLNEDDIKKVIELMQQKLVHGQSNVQDTRSRNDNDDFNDNDKRNDDYRPFNNLNDLNDVIRTHTETYKENPLTILIYRAKDKPQEPQDDIIIKNILKELILHNKLNHKNHQMKSKPHFKTNDFSNEVKDLKKFSKLYLILNTSSGTNSLNKEDLDDIGGLLSKLLSTKANKSNNKGKRYYKGFVVNDDESSRRRHDSNESEDGDYRPKRSRIRKGVSVGGRTFAPSTGKKRNIYESE